MIRNEIYVAGFPFGDKPELKLRPVLLLTGKVGKVPEVLVAYISSVVPNQLLHTDILIDPTNSEHLSTKLKKISVLRLHKLATIHASSLKRKLGKISDSVTQEVQLKLKLLLEI